MERERDGERETERERWKERERWRGTGFPVVLSQVLVGGIGCY